ncbi:ATP phosphoribosyltransferase regulatory subunit [Flavobacterium sp.]|jgi:histidyl-tRNA synthetase|uniref:ATP phosphoribosyltransferase regulatory subunit n=1 Tax=Flavobacterium sp. TaxID=239 RepID=UPI0037BFFFB2
MKEIKNNCYKGTRILLGNEKRDLVNKMIAELKEQGFQEIQVPIIQQSSVFFGKVGEENSHRMYKLTDKGGRDLCLAPEYTAVIQQLAQTYFKNDKDVKLFYVAECFRGDNPQLGRWRQFTQLGVEILNPTRDWSITLTALAGDLLNYNTNDFELILNNIRGLDYYKDFTFEIQHRKSGLSVCGGGAYEGGIGFAIGLDRLMKLSE